MNFYIADQLEKRRFRRAHDCLSGNRKHNTRVGGRDIVFILFHHNSVASLQPLHSSLPATTEAFAGGLLHT